MERLVIEWSSFKAVQARDLFPVYYVDRTGESNPEYQVHGANDNFFFTSKAIGDPAEVGTDAKEFSDTYLAGATEVSAASDALALAMVSISAPTIWVRKYASLTTEDNAEATIITHEVSAGKRFYLVHKTVTINAFTALRALVRCRVGSSVVHRNVLLNSGTDHIGRPYTDFTPALPVYWAKGGDTITVSVEEEDAYGNSYFATLIGFEK